MHTAVKFIDSRDELVDARGGGRGKGIGSWCLVGMEFHFGRVTGWGDG